MSGDYGRYGRHWKWKSSLTAAQAVWGRALSCHVAKGNICSEVHVFWIWLWIEDDYWEDLYKWLIFAYRYLLKWTWTQFVYSHDRISLTWELFTKPLYVISYCSTVFCFFLVFYGYILSVQKTISVQVAENTLGLSVNMSANDEDVKKKLVYEIIWAQSTALNPEGQNVDISILKVR